MDPIKEAMIRHEDENGPPEERIAKHTPGPWTGERVHCHEACVYVDMARPGMDEDDGEVAVVYARRFQYARSIDQAKADARLIAAAPDLFAAIKNSDDAHWTPAMRAAVAKAEGRTP